MRKPVGYGWCSWETRTCLLGRHYVWFPPMSGLWGPSLACIAFDSWDFLSHLLFVEMWVELELSSYDMWQVGGDLSLGCISYSLEGNSTFPGYVASSFCLEFICRLLGCPLRGGLDEDTWIRNTLFSSPSLLVSQSRACICLLLFRWRLSLLSCQLK